MECPVKVFYKGSEIAAPMMADIVVDGKVIIETKALKCIYESEVRQLFTYLRLTGFELGYLINFGVDDFCTGNFTKEMGPYKRGIYRMANLSQYNP